MEVSNTIYCSHYNNKHLILLVGEGDFSFSLCLAKTFGSATNISATSLDTREELERKYKDAKKNVEELERRGCTVVHGVNVHSMNTDCRVYRSILYDRIIFNFPHAGFHLVASMRATPSDMIPDTKTLDEEPDDAMIIPDGPITRSKARKLAEAVRSLLEETRITEDQLTHPVLTTLSSNFS